MRVKAAAARSHFAVTSALPTATASLHVFSASDVCTPKVKAQQGRLCPAVNARDLSLHGRSLKLLPLLLLLMLLMLLMPSSITLLFSTVFSAAPLSAEGSGLSRMHQPAVAGARRTRRSPAAAAVALPVVGFFASSA